jgi:hypothetical protein
MHPGHCFLWHLPGDCTFYSVVLDTPGPLVEVGLRRTLTYGAPFPVGREAYVHQDVAVTLLSQEQMALARKLGWPGDNDTLLRIFAVPPN